MNTNQPNTRQALNQRFERLQDRLGRIDQINQEVVPMFQTQALEGRPVGMKPSETWNRADVMADQGVMQRSAASEDESNVLGQLLQLDQTEADNAFRREQFDYQKQSDGQDRALKGQSLLMDMLSKGITYDEKGNLKVVDGMNGSDAIAKVIKEGGGQLLGLAKDKDSREALAKDILKTGGVAEYRKTLPVEQLVSDAERGKLSEQNELLVLIDQAIPTFSNGDKWGGTGWFEQWIPNQIATKNIQEMRRQSDTIRSMYQKAISGATVSDQEVERLKKFLPSSDKNESQNLEDLQKLRRDLSINAQIFELGKREGLTPNEAYRKHGKELFAQFGEDRSDILDDDDEAIIQKYKGGK